MDAKGKLLDAEITSKLNMSDCTTSGAILDLEEGTSKARECVSPVLGSTVIHCCRLVLVLQVSRSWSPGHNTGVEVVSVKLPT